MAKHTTKINKRLAIGLMALFGLSPGWAASSEAAPITFDFTGTFTRAGVDIPISGSYTFESTTADGLPSGNVGLYKAPVGAPYGFTVTVQGQTFGSSDALTINLANDLNDLDLYQAFGCGGGDSCPDGSIGLVLRDDQAAMFSSDALPVQAPSLGGLDLAQFTLRFPGGDTTNEVTGILTSLTCAAGCSPIPDPGPGPTPDPTAVPEPGTLLLLSPALALLARVRRRINRAS